MKKLVILTAIVLLFQSIALGYAVTTEVDTTKIDMHNIHVGDRIYFNVSVTHDDQSIVEYVPQKPNEIFIVLAYSSDTQPVQDELQTNFHFISALFDTGLQTIPGQEFTLASGNDSILFYSDSLQVMVQSVIQNDSVDLKDIKPPVSLTLGFWDIALPILILVVIIIVIILITRKKKGLAIIPEKKKKVLPAHVIALKKIEQLKLQDYIEKGELKRYCVEVSWICREFLENRYHRPFLEMTGCEIRQSLKELNVDKRVETNSILQECDRVKFAKYIPAIEEAQKILDELVDVIQSTKEKEVQEETHEN